MVQLRCFLVLVLVAATAYAASVSYAGQKKRDRNDYNARPKRIVCYWGTWAYYRDTNNNNKDAFRIEAGDLDDPAQKCTHIVYTFAKLDEYNYTMQPFDPYLETTWDSYSKDYYRKFIAFKERNPLLTTMIAIGGWFEGSEKYSDMAKSQELRKKFVSQAVLFLKQWGFDGLDVDWEYPATRLGKPEDKEDFILLLEELDAAFRDEGFLLTAALSPGKGTIDKAYDRASIARINQLLDWANIMTYDYHGGWEMTLGHNAPLYKRPQETDDLHTWFNIDYTIRYFLELGLKKEKMVMGLPFYGRGWAIKDASTHKISDAATGMSTAGRLTGQDGILGYNELCELQAKGGWTTDYDPYYLAPFTWNDKQWIGFDNMDSLVCKIKYMKEMGLSGGMVWALEMDDFKGDKCGYGRYPLLTTVYENILGSKKDALNCPLKNDNIPVNPDPVVPNNHQCKEAGPIPHPTDPHKYILCEYVVNGPNGGWFIHIMGCAPGTKWSQSKAYCDFE